MASEAALAPFRAAAEAGEDAEYRISASSENDSESSDAGIDMHATANMTMEVAADSTNVADAVANASDPQQ